MVAYDFFGDCTMRQHAKDLDFKEAFRRQFYPDHIRERCKQSNTEASLNRYLMRQYKTACLEDLDGQQLKDTNGVVSMWIDMMNEAITHQDGKIIRPKRWNK